MVYVQRDGNGRVDGIFVEPQYDGMEKIDSQHEEVLNYLKTCENIEIYNQLLTDSDTSIARIIEDVIDLLIEKKVISFTELPVQAQQKLKHRKSMRIEREKVQLLVDDIV